MMKISEFNNITSQDVVNTKRKVFKVMESVSGVVPISLAEQVTFCHCENDKVNYYISDYKLKDNSVICENIKKINIDFTESKQELTNVVNQVVESIINKTPLDSIKDKMIESVKKYVTDSNYKKLTLAPKISESIKRKVKNSHINQISRATAVKIRETLSKLKKDYDPKQKSNPISADLDSGKFTFKPSAVKGKSKQFENTMIWNMKRTKNLSETKDYAEKLKAIYDSYIAESSDFAIRVNEMASTQGIELLTINELANMFNKSSIILGYTIDEQCGGEMLEKIFDSIITYKKPLIKNAIDKILPELSEDMEMSEVIKNIRRHIYLVEMEQNRTAPSEPSAEEIDKNIAIETGDEVDAQVYDYTIEDATIILETLTEILKDKDIERYNKLFPKENETIDDKEQKTDDGFVPDENVLEAIKSTAQLIYEDIGLLQDEDDIVAIAKADIENEDLINTHEDDIEPVNDEEISTTDIVVGYINDIDMMIDNDTIDVDQFENIIEFIVNYYESAETVEKTKSKEDGIKTDDDITNKNPINDEEKTEDTVENAIVQKSKEMPALMGHKKSIV